MVVGFPGFIDHNLGSPYYPLDALLPWQISREFGQDDFF